MVGKLQFAAVVVVAVAAAVVGVVASRLGSSEASRVGLRVRVTRHHYYPGQNPDPAASLGSSSS